MPQMIILVIDEVENFPAVMEVWERVGCQGITVHQTTGLGRVMRHRDDLPLIPSLRSLFESNEESHRTIWTVVPDDFDVDRLFDETEKIVGELDAPDTGIMFVVPVTKVRGLRQRTTRSKESA